MKRVKDEGCCADCGAEEAVVLEFDHVAAKVSSISAMVSAGTSIKALRDEIAACELVCANCHRRRTARRAGWRRAATPWWRSPAPVRHSEARNYAYLYSYLERTPCADCGEADLIVLECDHVMEKSRNVTDMVRDGVRLSRLQAEIALCQVRCANCHRRVTESRRSSTERPGAE